MLVTAGLIFALQTPFLGFRSNENWRTITTAIEVETGIEPVCTALQAVASPLGHSTVGSDATCTLERMTGFEPATLTLAR